MPPEHIPHGVAKSGWLYRQSTVLHRWKKSFVVFYTDGRLAYFEDEKSTTAEDVINIPRDRAIILGPEYCADVNPPDTKGNDLLFVVKTQEKTWSFCAENKDELMAWKYALQEAFNIKMPQKMAAPQYDPYTEYRVHVPPGSTIVVGDRGPVIYDPQGRVIYVNEDPRFRRRDDSCSGLLTGAAVGSLMLWPFWWPWWFFWF